MSPFTHGNRKAAPGDDAYDKVRFRGQYVNKRTRAALLEAEERLGYELTIIQGGYSDGSLSAGSHLYGNAVDLSPYEWRRKVRVLKALGFAVWHRPYNWDSRGGGEHIHALLLGDKEAAGLAKAQMDGFLRGRNGLGSPPNFNAASPPISQPPVPPVVFNYGAWVREQTRAKRVRHNVALAIKRLQVARRNSDTAKERTAFNAAIKAIRNRNH